MARAKIKKDMKNRPRGGASILCPHCRGRSYVKYTFRRTNDNMILRQHECDRCHEQFMTRQRTITMPPPLKLRPMTAAAA